MTKKAVIDEMVAARSMSRGEAERQFDSVVAGLRIVLAQSVGSMVRLEGIGTLRRVEKKGRKFYNPHSGQMDSTAPREAIVLNEGKD